MQRWRAEIRDAAGVSVTARAVGWCVSCYMDAAGRAVVAYATIARRLEVDARTIRRAAYELEQAGLLRIRPGVGRASTRWVAQVRGETDAPPAELVDGYWQAKLDLYLRGDMGVPSRRPETAEIGLRGDMGVPSEGTPVSPVLEVQRSAKGSRARARGTAGDA